MCHKVNPFRRSEISNTLPNRQILENVRNLVPFVSIRFCHGFWEYLCKFQSFYFLGTGLRPYDQNDVDSYQKHMANIGDLLHNGYMLRLLELLQSIDIEGLLLCVSMEGWPLGTEIEGTPLLSDCAHEMVEKVIPEHIELYDGLWPKKSLFNKELLTLIEALKDREVVIIGPNRCRSFPMYCKFTSYHIIEIPDPGARRLHSELETKIRKQLNVLKDLNPVVLFDAGTMSAFWALRLRNDFSNVTFIDLGQVLEVFNFKYSLSRNYGRVYRSEILDFFEEFDIDLSQLRAFRSDYPIPVKVSRERRKIKLFENKFVNKQAVDSPRLTSILGTAERMNREVEITFSKIRGTSKGIICSKDFYDSVLSILKILTDDNKWKTKILSSQFSILNPSIDLDGQVHEIQKFIDEDFHVEIGRALELNDRVVILCSGIFDSRTLIQEVTAMGENKNIFVIVESYSGLSLSLNHDSDSQVIEVVDLSDKSPFGFDDICCIISDQSLLSQLRNALMVRPVELDLRFELQRMLTYENWFFLYQMQARRILNIALTAGLSSQLTFNFVKNSILNFILCFSRRELTEVDLHNSEIELLLLTSVFDGQSCDDSRLKRGVLIPCHPEVSLIPSDRLYEIFESLA